MSSSMTNVNLFKLLREYGAFGKDIKHYMKAIGRWTPVYVKQSPKSKS